MIELLVNYATAIAFIALTIDIMLQIRKLIRRKSAKDISRKGCTIRLIAILLLEAKFIVLKDFWLILGQGLFNVLFLVYFVLILKYRKKSF